MTLRRSFASIPASGGKPVVLLSGDGRYIPNFPFDTPSSTYHWFAQPTWSPDNQHLLFLSDMEKFYPRPVGTNSFLLDFMAFSIAINNPTSAKAVSQPTCLVTRWLTDCVLWLQ